MSSTELRRARAHKHLCQRCRDRKARFRYRGVVRADCDHTLCFECYRRELNRARARRLADPRPPVSPFRWYGGGPAGVLNDRQIAHRRRMLDHLQQRSVVAS